MASSAYDNLNGMVVNTKAAAIYAAFESSMFLSGQLIPTIQVPAGSYTAQVPLLTAPSTFTVDTAEHGVNGDFTTEDITASDIDATGHEVRAKTYAARTVLRNIGGVNPTEIGTVIGHQISNAYDVDVMAALRAGTPAGHDIASGGALTMDMLFEAASKIREAGEMGTLVGIISPAMAYQLMQDIQGTGFAGGDYQGEALRNGFLTQAAGINLFQSSHAKGTGALGDGVIFGANCARQAAFSALDVTVTPAPTKVGMDVVGSLAQGVKVIDGNRSSLITVA
jgi:hypothetical protein